MIELDERERDYTFRAIAVCVFAVRVISSTDIHSNILSISVYSLTFITNSIIFCMFAIWSFLPSRWLLVRSQFLLR